MPQQNSKHYQVPFGNDANFVNHPGAADIRIQPKSPKFLLDMRYFCNFSLVSLGIRPRSRRCAERTRQGERRWSRPPKAALERSYIRPRIPVPRIAYFGRDEKLLTKYLTPKKDFISYMYVGVGDVWHRRCKTCQSLRELDNRGTGFFLLAVTMMVTCKTCQSLRELDNRGSVFFCVWRSP